ncbi:MAG: hypothetical protein ACT4P7_02115 [Gemmatimonadaceae bacterium]
MLIGVLLFGGVVYYVRQSQAPPGVAPDDARALLWIGRAIWGLAIIGCAILFQVIQRGGVPGKVRSYRIVAWALGEMVALYGGVIWFLTGTPSWYVPGLVFLLLAFLAFPVRGD